MNPKFKNLTISGWRQFHNVSIDFHPRLTVITGANGAGKSSLLGLLTQHFGWQKLFLGTPLKRRINGLTRFLSGVRRRRNMHDHEQEVLAIPQSLAPLFEQQSKAFNLQFQFTISSKF